MVYSIAYHFFNDAARAEDLAQDVFLQLFENLRSIRSADHLKSWLRRATTHRCIDTLRHRSYHDEIQVDELPEVISTEEEADPLRDDKLRLLVASLPEKQRMIIILRFGQGLEAVEIADAMNLPVATVRSYQRRALALLREKADRCLGEVRNGSI
jgi:RNA polymerase sigma-70 factor (ECF subfamily)